MPRNKSKKRKISSHQSNHHALASLKKIEKKLLSTPTQLAAQLRKDILALQKKEAKLKKAISKLNNRTKNAENRVKSTEKNKHTSTGKKRFLLAKKSHNELAKTQLTLDKALAATSNSLESYAKAQAKSVALGKYLTQFEKEWAKSSKKSTIKAVKPKKKKNKPATSIEEKSPSQSSETIEDVFIRESEVAEVVT